MSRRDRLVELRHDTSVVLPSLLLCDFGNLERELGRLQDAGVKALHLDVMDGHFVPNLTYGMPIVSACRQLTDMPLDVHLMVSDPDAYLPQFFDAGADVITVHVEACQDPRATLQTIRDLGAASGLAFNPQTPLEELAKYADLCDLVLIMSVEAGFGGQAFNPGALDRLAQARSIVGPDVVLEVDGGINRETIASCAAAGAEWFVVGSGIFRQSDYTAAVRNLLDLARPPLTG